MKLSELNRRAAHHHRGPVNAVERRSLLGRDRVDRAWVGGPCVRLRVVGCGGGADSPGRALISRAAGIADAGVRGAVGRPPDGAEDAGIASGLKRHIWTCRAVPVIPGIPTVP